MDPETKALAARVGAFDHGVSGAFSECITVTMLLMQKSVAELVVCRPRK